MFHQQPDKLLSPNHHEPAELVSWEPIGQKGQCLMSLEAGPGVRGTEGKMGGGGCWRFSPRCSQTRLHLICVLEEDQAVVSGKSPEHRDCQRLRDRPSISS